MSRKAIRLFTSALAGASALTIVPAVASGVLLGTGTLNVPGDLTRIQAGNSVLEFLDLSATTGYSVGSATSAFGNNGFRWANGTEVSNLFSAFGIGYLNQPGAVTTLSGSATQRSNFISYLGSTTAGGSLGWLDDLTTGSQHTYGCIGSTTCGTSQGAGGAFLNNTKLFWPSNPSIGVFLVRNEATTTATVHSGPGSITTNLYTSGAAATPWTVAANITSIAPVVLGFNASGIDAVGPTNTAGSGYVYGKWISETVTNNTDKAWTSFDFELQSQLGVPSTNGDGLSFAQGGNFSFTSDRFSNVHRDEETRDFLNFDGGTVGVGQSVRFNFAITDNQAHEAIYLSETANRSVSSVPEPANFAMLLLGLATVAATMRRRSATA